MYEQQYNPYSNNIAIIKGYFKSGSVLALGIMYAVSSVITIWYALSNSGANTIYTALRLLEQMGADVPSEVYTYIGGSGSIYNVLTVIFSSIVPILSALAFILMFALSHSSSETTGPGAGITIMRVLSIIFFIATIVLVSLFGVLYAIILVGALSVNSRYGSSSITVYLVIMTIVLIGVAIVVIAYAASRKNFYRSAQHSLNTPNLYNQGAGAYGVFNIILAVFAVIGFVAKFLPSSVLGGYVYFHNTAVSIISDVMTIALYICTAIVALGYKSYINRQLYSYNNTPYGGGGYNGGYNPTPNYQTPYQNYNGNYNNNNYNNYNGGYNGNYSDNYNSNNNNYNDNYSDNDPGYTQAATYCPNCGTPVSSSEAYCPNCGTRI